MYVCTYIGTYVCVLSFIHVCAWFSFVWYTWRGTQQLEGSDSQCRKGRSLRYIFPWIGTESVDCNIGKWSRYYHFPVGHAIFHSVCVLFCVCVLNKINKSTQVYCCLPSGASVICTAVLTILPCFFLVNEGIGHILVIQTFDPSTVSVLYNKDVYPTSSIVWSTTFPFNIFKSH